MVIPTSQFAGTGPTECRCEFYEPWEHQDGECSCGHALAEHLGQGRCIAVAEVKDTSNDPAVLCPSCGKSLGFGESQLNRADDDLAGKLIDACGRHSDAEGGDWWSGIRVPQGLD